MADWDGIGKGMAWEKWGGVRMPGSGCLHACMRACMCALSRCNVGMSCISMRVQPVSPSSDPSAFISREVRWGLVRKYLSGEGLDSCVL
jgi:hypothetical protein